MKPIYLDNNATTRPAEAVIEAMRETLTEHWANPSSVHRAGQNARQRLELAREQVCRLIGCRDRELVFTSGGTEATSFALLGSLEARPDRRAVVTCRLEHNATRETVEQLERRGSEIVWFDLDERGIVDLDALSDLLRRRGDEIGVVSLLWANNETGAIQPIREVGERCGDSGVIFHCDATQWVGKMPTDVSQLPIDLMTFSAHKFHGPKGVGGLFIRRGVRLRPQIVGGPQERERRGGTENTPGIIGMGVAANLAQEWLQTAKRDEMARVRNEFEEEICRTVRDTTINAADAPRLWNTSNLAFARLEAEAILLLLSERGVYASAGAACSSGSLEPSPVLLAMGIPPEQAHGSIRFSISRETTREEIRSALDIIPEVITRLRRSMAAV